MEGNAIPERSAQIHALRGASQEPRVLPAGTQPQGRPPPGGLRGTLLRAWRLKTTATLVLALLVGLVSILPLTHSLSYYSYDVPFFFRHPSVPDDVVIVYMDDDSRDKL